MTTLDIEGVDLAVLVNAVRERFDTALSGAVVGRTNMRDAVMEHLGCSALEAEQLVDTLVSRGLVHLDRDRDGREVWRLTGGA